MDTERFGARLAVVTVLLLLAAGLSDGGSPLWLVVTVGAMAGLATIGLIRKLRHLR